MPISMGFSSSTIETNLTRLYKFTFELFYIPVWYIFLTQIYSGLWTEKAENRFNANL